MELFTTLSKQEKRSALMRDRILIATLDSIYDVGLHNTSTNVVTHMAGVSRGALLHHFPTKEILIASAVERLLDAEITDIRKIADAYSNNELTIDDFIDDLWQRFSGRLFMVTMDFLSSARTDSKLQDAIAPISLKFHASLNDIWTQFFTYRGLSQERVQVLLNTTLCLMRGMGVQTIIRDDPSYYNNMISAWKEILHSILDEHQEK